MQIAAMELQRGVWRTLLTGPMSGASNMALDHALMARARRSGERVFRVYSWTQPTLSLGRHQLALGRIDPEHARRLGVALVRRPTGGRALLHHREVTYSVTAPLGRTDSVREWYDSINGVLLSALHALGVRAEPAAVTTRTPSPGTASCFVRADEGEISLGGRKLVGSALLRQDDALLQHGSILLDDDQALLDELLPEDEQPSEPAGTLRAALGPGVSLQSVSGALFNALGASGVSATALTADARLQADAVEAERLYSSEEWTFRA
jgi:lipoate-protein ligase A